MMISRLPPSELYILTLLPRNTDLTLWCLLSFGKSEKRYSATSSTQTRSGDGPPGSNSCVENHTSSIICGSEDVETDTNQADMYELLQLMSSLNDTRRSILLALAHIYPRSVSGVQLSRLIGYSGKSRSLYRGVISHLKENEMIQIDQLTPKLYAIRINNEHPLLSVLVDLCKVHGQQSRRVYLKALEEE